VTDNADTRHLWSLFDGFEEFDIETSGATIHGRRGGSGPPVLLLHGIPETHLMWHRVARRLAEHYTVVATDLRGYGDSSKPASTRDHQPSGSTKMVAPAAGDGGMAACFAHEHLARTAAR
jgi:pimeloyl-ACP methyl ester carboxylesterase